MYLTFGSEKVIMQGVEHRMVKIVNFSCFFLSRFVVDIILIVHNTEAIHGLC